MTPRCAWGFTLLDRALLCGASLLVSANRRPEWRREWLAELWHVRRESAPAGAASWRTEREVAAFCLGAFQDAACLRRGSRQKKPAPAPLHGSAWQCLLWLAAILMASSLAALLLPGVRAESDASRSRIRPGLILIQNARYNNDSAATIPIEQFRTWKLRRQRYFDGFAFYRISPESVPSTADPKSTWQVAHASSNLFALLGMTVRFSASGREPYPTTPQVVLSDEAWTREFGRNPHIVGSFLRLGSIQARIAGVAPDRAWRLPGKADAWLLEPDSAIASGRPGYAVAHLTPQGQSEMWTARVHISAYNSNGSEDDLWGVAFDENTPGPWSIYEFAVFLAFLALPAVTSVFMSEFSVSSHRPSFSRRLLRRGFMAAKIALILPIVYFVSLDLAYCHTTHDSVASLHVQLLASFLISLFGLRWALLDQRLRCPVCLRRVSNPARVGQASRTFLAWNGTELVCLAGHTLLHVPGLPTSWFSTQRWLYLDASWDFLFAGPGIV